MGARGAHFKLGLLNESRKHYIKNRGFGRRGRTTKLRWMAEVLRARFFSRGKTYEIILFTTFQPDLSPLIGHILYAFQQEKNRNITDLLHNKFADVD
jgi:hypothetical protein